MDLRRPLSQAPRHGYARKQANKSRTSRNRDRMARLARATAWVRYTASRGRGSGQDHSILNETQFAVRYHEALRQSDSRGEHRGDAEVESEIKEGMMNQTRLALLLFITTSCYAQEPRQATLAQQKMCADQVRKFFLDPEMRTKAGRHTPTITTQS